MADERTRQLLAEWNLEIYIPTFEDQAIGYDTLCELTKLPDYKEIVGQLIPKIGHQIGFKKKLEAHFNNPNKKIVAPIVPIVSAPPINTTIIHTPPTLIPVHQPDKPPIKKIRRKYLPAAFVLENMLQKNCTGRALISFYAKNKTLDSKCRSYLVDIIVEYFLGHYNSRLTNDIFAEIASEIIKVFPTEVKEAYFIPAVKKKDSMENRAEISRGKLVDKYRNKLTFLRKANVLPFQFKDSNEEDTDKSMNSDSILGLSTWASADSTVGPAGAQELKPSTIYFEEHSLSYQDSKAHFMVPEHSTSFQDIKPDISGADQRNSFQNIQP